MSDKTVLIADDHTAVRKGVRSLLDGYHHLKVIAEAADGEEAVEKALELKPDMIILDLTMPIVDGLTAARAIRKIAPETSIVVFTMHQIKELVEAVKAVGARGFVSKAEDGEGLLHAVDAILDNQNYFPA